VRLQPGHAQPLPVGNGWRQMGHASLGALDTALGVGVGGSGSGGVTGAGVGAAVSVSGSALTRTPVLTFDFV